MEMSFTEQTQIYKDGGIVYLIFRADAVSLTGEEPGTEKTNLFYENWLRILKERVESGLLPALKADYAADTSPKKRFSHRPAVLLYTCRPVPEEKTQKTKKRKKADRCAMRVRRTVTLSHGGDGDMSLSEEDVLREDGYLAG